MSSLAVSRHAYNEEVLRTHDATFAQLLFVSSVCDVYKFAVDADAWVQKNVKGTLFLYATQNPRQPFTVLVLNRLAPQDFAVDLVPAALALAEGVEPTVADMQDNTIMIQTPGAVYGLWLFEEADRAPLLALARQCLGQR